MQLRTRRTVEFVLSMVLAFVSPVAAKNFQVIHTFNGSNGANPMGGLLSDGSGNLFGTTSAGGDFGFGTIFQLTPVGDGTWTETILYSFQGSPDGNQPHGNLLRDSAGNLYGTTALGGYGNGDGMGTVYELSPTGNSWTEKVIHRFGQYTDGYVPMAGLVMDSRGTLYGTTVFSGAGGLRGGVFELAPYPTGLWRYEFLGETDGVCDAPLVVDAKDNLFGVSVQNIAQYGTVFQVHHHVNPSYWTIPIIHLFNGTDGDNPFGGLSVDAKGNLYGTTESGGTGNFGTVFKLTRSQQWAETVIHDFTIDELVIFPDTAPLLAPDGRIYGTGQTGLWVLTPYSGNTWAFSALGSFQQVDGLQPRGDLVMDGAGNVFGTNSNGGAGYGTVFELSP